MNEQKLQELLDTYGEYGITYEIAKESKLLEVQYYENFDTFKKYTLEYISTRSEESERYIENLDTVFDMYLEHLNIEVTGYGLDENGEYDTNKLSCIIFANDNHGWDCYGLVTLNVDESILESKETLEKAMLDMLILCAKEYQLTWSKPNADELCDIIQPDICFSHKESINQIDEQIKERADSLGLNLGEYFKRLAMADIRRLNGLEVEPEYRLNQNGGM